MTVYFAQNRNDDTSVKIGFTTDINARVKNLSVGVPGGVMVLASILGAGKETEEYLHGMFAEDRISGEWFRYSERLRDFVRDARNGDLPRLPFQDAAIGHSRSATDFSKEAVEYARQMALALVNDEFKGIGDTADAARHRVEKKTGFPAAWLHRLQYRALNDVPAGIYLHLVHLRDARGSKVVWLADLVAGKEDEGIMK